MGCGVFDPDEETGKGRGGGIWEVQLTKINAIEIVDMTRIVLDGCIRGY
jgi:hypothetical protein